MALRDAGYPRRKNFIHNLNILLNSTPLLPPDKVVQHRLFPKQVKALGLQSPPSLIKITEHKRLLSLRKIKQRVQQQQSTLKQKLSRKAQSACQISSTRYIQEQGVLKYLQSGQPKEQQRILQSQCCVRNPKKTAQLNTSLPIQGSTKPALSMSHSLQVKSSIPEIEVILRNADVKVGDGLLYDYQPKSQTKREYLKKGSSINNSIIQNLIKLKLKQNQEQKSPPEEYLESKHIFKMMKVYKGSHAHNLKQIHSMSPQQKRIIKKHDPLYIDGWFQEFPDDGHDGEQHVGAFILGRSASRL